MRYFQQINYLLTKTIRKVNAEGFITISNKLIDKIKSGKLSETISNIETNRIAENAAKVIFEKQQAEKTPAQIEKDLNSFKLNPTISIIMPVYNTEIKWLTRAIESVLKQQYKNWQLCIVDDGSEDDRIAVMLSNYCNAEDRIKVFYSENNQGISASSNKAIDMSDGDYIGLLDHDDELTPDALYWMAYAINEAKEPDLIYSDECKIDDTEKRRLFGFMFKPDWSPEMLFNGMYIGHFSLYKKELLCASETFRPAYDFSQDYDLALRFTEKNKRIYHLERILYLWRAIDGSAAKGGKDFARASNLNALQSALERRKLDAKAMELPIVNYVHFNKIDPKNVSIIIASNSSKNLSVCLEAIMKTTDHENFEIVVISNSEVCSKLVKELQLTEKIKFKKYDKTLNFSDKYNLGAANSKGNFLVFYNDELIPLKPEWLTNLIEYLMVPGVGGVSPKLIDKKYKIKHAGMILDTQGIVGTPYNGYGYEEYDEFMTMHCWVRNVSVLSGTCMAIQKETFNCLGGFDSINNQYNFAYVDLSLRIAAEKKLRCVYTPHSVLIYTGNHLHGGVTDEDKLENHIFQKWEEKIAYDPYFTESMRKVLYSASPKSPV